MQGLGATIPVMGGSPTVIKDRCPRSWRRECSGTLIRSEEATEVRTDAEVSKMFKQNVVWLDNTMDYPACAEGV